MGRITGDLNLFQSALEASNARVIAFGASTAVLGGLVKGFKDLAKTTIEIEKAFIDINRILNISDAGFQKFGNDLFNVAKQTASTFQSASNAALEFSRQGLNTEEVLKRTADALTLVRLTGINAEKSVSLLTATVNAFQDIDTTQAVNKFVAVETKFAVAARDLVEGLSRVGSAAQDAKVDFDELNALITAVQQTTGRGGAVIGNALKTIFTRLQRESTLNALEKFNITVRDVEGNILPAVQILDDFAAKYDGLADSTQAYLREQVAGVFQANILSAILKDLNREQANFNSALEVSRKATDEAAKANSRLNQSLTALIQNASTEFAKLQQNIGEKSFTPIAKKLVGAFEDVSKNINEAIDGEGVGSDIANSLIKGIKNIFGPALLGAFAIIGKVAINSLSYLTKSLPILFGITTETQKRAQTEQFVLKLLENNKTLSASILGNNENLAAQLAIVASESKIITEQYQAQVRAAQQISQAMGKAGVTISPTGVMTGGLGPKGPASEAKIPGIRNLAPQAQTGIREGLNRLLFNLNAGAISMGEFSTQAREMAKEAGMSKTSITRFTKFANTLATSTGGIIGTIGKLSSRVLGGLALGTPIIGGIAEQAIFGGRDRATMSTGERFAQGALGTGTSMLGTGAFVGSMFAPGIGTAIGGAIGLVAGLGIAAYGASKSLDELKAEAENYTRTTNELKSQGQEYIRLQESLLTASASELPGIQKQIAEQFEKIKGTELEKTFLNSKGNIEALTKALADYTKERITGSAKAGLTVSGKQFDLPDAKQLSQFSGVGVGTTGGVSLSPVIKTTEGGLTQAEKLAKARSVLGTDLRSLFGDLDQRGIGRLGAIGKLGTRTQLEQEILGTGKFKDITEVQATFGNFSDKILSYIFSNLGEIIAEEPLTQAQIAARAFNESFFNLAESLTSMSKNLEQSALSAELADVKLKQQAEYDLEIMRIRGESATKISDIAAEEKGRAFGVATGIQQQRLAGGAIQTVSGLLGKQATEGGFRKTAEIYDALAGFQALTEAAPEKASLFLQDLIDTVKDLEGDAAEKLIEALTLEKQNIDNKNAAIENDRQNLINGINLEQRRAANAELERQNANILAKLQAEQGLTRARGEAGRAVRGAELEGQLGLLGQDPIKAMDLFVREYQIREQILELKKEEAVQTYNLLQSQILIEKSQINTLDITDEEKSRRKELLDLQLQTAASARDEAISTAEIAYNLGQATAKRKAETSTFKGGFKQGIRDITQATYDFEGKIGRELPAMFQNGMVKALEATMDQADNLGDVLKGVAADFLREIRGALLTQATGQIMSAFGFETKSQKGGYIKAQNGMYISGGRTGDRNPALLEDGEYVLNRNAVKALGGPRAIDQLNFGMAPRFAGGGAFLNENVLSSRMSGFFLAGDNPELQEQRDLARAREQKRRQKKQQKDALLRSLASTVIVAGIGAGLNYAGESLELNRQIKAAGGTPSGALRKQIRQAGGIDAYAQSLGYMNAQDMKNAQGMMGRHQGGGYINSGFRSTDSVPTFMAGGEYVMNNRAVKKYGLGFMNRINGGYIPTYQAGGSVAETAATALGGSSSNTNNISINLNMGQGGMTQVGMSSGSGGKDQATSAKELSKRIESAVVEVIQREQRVGGLLSSNGGRR